MSRTISPGLVCARICSLCLKPKPALGSKQVGPKGFRRWHCADCIAKSAQHPKAETGAAA